MKRITAVIGAGAAGMMAAYAASRDASVTLFEKNEKPGRKIYITGKGRCNVTNACDFDTFIGNVVTNPRFMYSSYRAMPCTEVMRMIEETGIRLKTERGNRVFPVSDHASDITKAFVRMMEAGNVCQRYGCEVLGIRRDTRGRFLLSVRERGQVTDFTADRVVVATGGLSYPSTGSTGDGYRFAEAFGLSVVPCAPALVPLETEGEDAALLQGVALKNVELRMFPEGAGKPVFSGQGELLFTHFGISGPLVLSASSRIAGELSRGARYRAVIDLKPALEPEILDKRILRDFEENRNMTVQNAVGGLLISALRPVILRRAGIPADKRVHDISREERHRLSEAIRNFSFSVTGSRGYNEAVITHGGVSVRELDARTMQSKKIPGLAFAGEVIDVDAYTGGFNLQTAFSTGWAAGTHLYTEETE